MIQSVKAVAEGAVVTSVLELFDWPGPCEETLGLQWKHPRCNSETNPGDGHKGLKD